MEAVFPQTMLVMPKTQFSEPEASPNSLKGDPDPGRFMPRPAKVIFFDLGEPLVTQNIEDNMVTKNALRQISPILPQRVPLEKLFELYRESYKMNETIRSSQRVHLPIQ